MPARTGMVATRTYVDSTVASATSPTGSGALAQELAAIKASIQTLNAEAVRYSIDESTTPVTKTLTIGGNTVVNGTLSIGTTNVETALSSLSTSLSGKQGVLTAGSNISISSSNLISFSRAIDSSVSASSTGLPTSAAVASYVSGTGYSLPVATVSTLGGVIIGTGLSVTSTGTISTTAERNTIVSVKVGNVDVTPDANRCVSIPNASSTSFGVVKIGSGLSISSGVVSTSAQENTIEEVALSGHTSALVPTTAKRVTIPVATSSGLSGLLKIDPSDSKLSIDTNGYLKTTGEPNSVTDVRDSLGNSFISSGSTVASIPYASASVAGITKSGDGLTATSGTLSVKVGTGVKIGTDGSVQADFDQVASKSSVDSKANQTSLDATNLNVTNLTTSVASIEITAGASDQLYNCTPDGSGNVALVNHGLNLVPVTMTMSSVTPVIPSASSSLLSRDFYMVLSFGSAWTGSSFSIAGISSATPGETIRVFKTAVGTFDFSASGLNPSAGDKILFYFTEIEQGVFMASSKKLISHSFSS